MKLTRELKTGFVSVAIIALFIWGYNYLKGFNLFDNAPRTYFAKFSNVDGLSTASSVTINGLKVGKVVDISFNENTDKPGELVVEFGVDSDFKFTKNSIAKIYSTSLMGGKGLAIAPSYIGENAVSGDFLKGTLELDMFSALGATLNPVQSKLESVLVSADSLLSGLNQVLDAKVREDLRTAISGLNETVGNYNKVAVSLDDMLVDNKESLTKSISNFEKTTSNLASISDSIAKSDLGGTIKKLETTVNSFNSILEGVDNGKGSLGKLLKDDGLYLNLENASKELEVLLREIKEHPKRFVHFSMFGKKEKEYKTVEAQ